MLLKGKEQQGKELPLYTNIGKNKLLILHNYYVSFQSFVLTLIFKNYCPAWKEEWVMFEIWQSFGLKGEGT